MSQQQTRQSSRVPTARCSWRRSTRITRYKSSLCRRWSNGSQSANREQTMIKTVLATASIAAALLAAGADAKEVRTKPAAAGAAVAAAPAAGPVQGCGGFYDDYARRGWGWGSGPGTSVGFGTFEGALPRYPVNEFPNWYGDCVNWGNYSATGSARW